MTLLRLSLFGYLYVYCYPTRYSVYLTLPDQTRYTEGPSTSGYDSKDDAGKTGGIKSAGALALILLLLQLLRTETPRLSPLSGTY